MRSDEKGEMLMTERKNRVINKRDRTTTMQDMTTRPVGLLQINYDLGYAKAAVFCFGCYECVTVYLGLAEKCHDTNQF